MAPLVAYATVPKRWPGETFVCLGGGPSLTIDDVTFCRGRARVLAVNDAYLLAPWADVLYACDAKWWKWHRGVPAFQGLKYSLDRRSVGPSVQILRNTGREGLELEPTGLRTGMNSGYQAINLAVHLGASRIVLLGYDMQADGARNHWFGEHPQRCVPPYAQFAHLFLRLVNPLRSIGVSVVNCSRKTALTCFPREELAHVFSVPVAQAS